MKFRQLNYATSLLVGLTLTTSSVCAQEGFTQVSLQRSNDGVLTVSWKIAGEAEPGEFSLEASPDLSPGSWSAVQGSPATSPAEGLWSLEFIDPVARERHYYRVVRGGEAVTAAFTASSAEIAEGASDPGVEVQLSQPIIGNVNWQLQSGDGSNPITGSTYLDGESSFRIGLPAAQENSTVDPLTYYSLALSADHGSRLRPGAATLPILLKDNDANWVGVLSDGENGNVPIVLKILQDANGLSALLSADTQASNPGFLPSGDHATTGMQFIPGGQFSATSAAIALPTGPAPFDGSVSMVLTFQAHDTEDEEDGQTVKEDLIEGTFTLATSFQSASHLNSTRTGNFSFQKVPAALPEIEPSLTNP